MANMTIRPFRPDTPNDKILNAIRHEATPDYQRRIPPATQADVKESLANLTNYTPAWNEFVSAIVNKVGLTIARNRNWTNPMAKFKRGMLEYGDTIEEIQTGLLEAYVYDHDQDYGERAIFGRERPEVQADYHKINRENFYKITVDNNALKRAFLTPTGLAEFVNKLMDAPTTSDNWDEYLLMRNLFALYEENGGFFKVSIPEIPSGTDATVEARQALRAIRAAKGKLTFLSRQYNAARMPVHADADELELFATPDFLAAIDVEGLAPLFNVAYGEVTSRVTVIDDFKFGDGDIQAILTTKDFFVVADTLYTTTNVANPVGLHENFFLHHHQIVSASRFVPAIAFTYGAGTVIDEIDPPVDSVEVAVFNSAMEVITDVERGHSYEVGGTAITDPEGGVRSSVVLTLTGAESSHTYLTQTGVLHVAADESAEDLTVTATATDDESISVDVALTVSGDILRLWPDPAIVDPEPDPDPGE